MPSLLEFSKTHSTITPKPYIIVWPAGAPVAVIGATVNRQLEPGQVKTIPGPAHSASWRKLPGGEIEATYHSKEELELALRLTEWLKEWETPVRDYQQAALIPTGDNYYQEG